MGRGKKQVEGSVPVKGAAVVEGGQPTEDQLSLQILLSRIEATEAQQRLEAAAHRQALEAQDKKYQALLKQLEREKAEALQGLQAAQEQLTKLHEQRPTDPATMRAVLAQLEQEARVNHVRKRERFKRRLAEAPRGRVANRTGKWRLLTINGISLWLKPGWNQNVPQPYIELWEWMQDAEVDAEARQALMRGSRSFGDLEKIIYEGRAKTDSLIMFDSAASTPRDPRDWDEDEGLI